MKPSDFGSGGKNIHIFRHNKKTGFLDYKGKILNLEYIRLFFYRNWIIQERINQISALSKIHKNSINTFRVITYYTAGYGAKVLYCMLKAGANNAHTDNAHTGGCYVKINIVTGELSDTAYDEELNEYKEHINTKYLFAGKKINEIREIIIMAEKYGNMFPTIAFVGWDITLTKNGPVLIEGNSSSGLTIIQRTHGGMADTFSKYYPLK
jgi:hypothetical protein